MSLASRSIPIARPLLLALIVVAVALLVALVAVAMIAAPHLAHQSLPAIFHPMDPCSGGAGTSC
jgi:hypothetical protein